MKIGYSETLPTAMQFPDHVKEPDREKLQVIAAELLMAKLEAEGADGHPLLTQQLSGGSLVSSPGTPTTGSGSELSPSLSYRPPPQENSNGSFTRSPSSSPSSSLHHHLQAPYTQATMITTSNGHYSPMQSVVQPTAAFTPHPDIIGAHNQPPIQYVPSLSPSFSVCFHVFLFLHLASHLPSHCTVFKNIFYKCQMLLNSQQKCSKHTSNY